MIWALVVACVAASVPAGLRWLRVGQREHYLAPSASRFALRWWWSTMLNRLLAGVAIVGVVGAFWLPYLGFLVVLAQVGPVGLTIRGTTSALAWTGRLKRLASISAVLAVLVYLGGALVPSAPLVVVGLLLLPVLVDVGAVVAAPIERRLGSKWVAKAAAKLQGSRAKVVAITGSYGKTTTKAYVAHLLDGQFRTVASPASFNNRMGLARAINEQLVAGTEVFVAEMGTYGPGEIADLCEWIPPDVAAMVAIGPVHLERFKSEERIVAAKSEILDRAPIGVISIDHPLLLALAEERESSMQVVTSSATGKGARVEVVGSTLYVDGSQIAPVAPDAFASNLAVAVGIAISLGAPIEHVAGKVASLPRPDHRQTVTTADRGFSIIDDTYNSNPAGGAAGLALVEELGAGGRKVVVTPGMVELGPMQDKENRAFAARAASIADDLVVVGLTNRKALTEGSKNGGASVTVVESRQDAVDWVRSNLGPGDVVLYENDLPDHYP